MNFKYVVFFMSNVRGYFRQTYSHANPPEMSPHCDLIAYPHHELNSEPGERISTDWQTFLEFSLQASLPVPSLLGANMDSPLAKLPNLPIILLPGIYVYACVICIQYSWLNLKFCLNISRGF